MSDMTLRRELKEPMKADEFYRILEALTSPEFRGSTQERGSIIEFAPRKIHPKRKEKS